MFLLRESAVVTGIDIFCDFIILVRFKYAIVQDREVLFRVEAPGQTQDPGHADWERLGILPQELEEVSGERKSVHLCTGCCPRDPVLDNAGEDKTRRDETRQVLFQELLLAPRHP